MRTQPAHSLSTTQRAVVAWLWHYPAVYIAWVGPLETSVDWTATWVSSDARKHMVATMRDLGQEVSQQVAGRLENAPSGATPRLRFGTFKALLRRGYLEVKHRREPRPGWTPMAYYQLSSAGKQAFLTVIPA